MANAEGRRLRRRLLAAGILGLWGAMLGLHADREYGGRARVRLADAAVRLSPRATYFAVKMSGVPVGFAASVLDTLPDGFRLTDDFRLFIQALGMAGEARARTEIELASNLRLRGFRFVLDSELGRFEATGAPVADTALVVRIRSGGEEQELRLPVEGPIVLPALLPLQLVLGAEPEVGKSYSFEVFDPSVLGMRRTEIRVLGQERLVVPDSAVYEPAEDRWVPATFDTVPTWHVEQTFGGVLLESWLDPDGHVVRASSPLGYTMERTAFEVAWNNLRALAAAGALHAGSPDIVERTAVASDVVLPSAARLQRLGVRIRDVELAGLDLGGGRQRLSGDTLWIEREELSRAQADYLLPADPARFGPALAAEPLVQADDPEIRATAERIVRGVRDPEEAARRLNEWVCSRARSRCWRGPRPAWSTCATASTTTPGPRCGWESGSPSTRPSGSFRRTPPTCDSSSAASRNRSRSCG